MNIAVRTLSKLPFGRATSAAPLLNWRLAREFLSSGIKFSGRSTSSNPFLNASYWGTRFYSSLKSPEEDCSLDQNQETAPDTVNITYIGRDGERYEIEGKTGDNVMYLAQRHDLDVEGACEASLACCTCHVYVKESFYDKLGEPTEEEEDMLDLAPFLQENSRLSCQIILSKEIDGIEVKIPSATRNFYVDGHKPKPH